MGKEYRAKIFKSGNSLALRLPKALGLEEGSEMVVREMRLGYSLEPVEKPKRKINASGFAGKAPGIRLGPREEFEDRPSASASASREVIDRK